MLVKNLNATNPHRDADMWEDYEALYKGGHCFKKRVKRFLVRNDREPFEIYEARCKEAVYRSYIGTVVDYFAAMLFSVPVIYKPDGGTPPEWFEAFENDCDGQGTDLVEFLRATVIDALTTKTATVLLDFPESYGKAASKYEADVAGATDIKLRRVDRSNILDWERDKRGRLTWLIAKAESKPRETPEELRSITRSEWTVADRENYDVYQVDAKEGEEPKPESSLGPTFAVAHRLGVVPALELTVDDGLWVANRLESAQLAHFRLTSGQYWSIKRTCYAMPLFRVADPENFKPSTMGTGYYIAIGNQDNADFMTPPVGHLAVTADEIKAQKDEIFRLVAQMSLGVDNNAAAVGRSGESKLADAEAIRVVLRAYAVLVRDFLRAALNLLSKARGETTQWTVEGLDKFDTIDAETLVGLLKIALIDVGIPSQMVQVEAKYRAAIGLLPGLDEEQRKTIHGEIEAGVAKEEQEETELVALARGTGSGEEEGSPEDLGGRGAPTAPAQETDEEGSVRKQGRDQKGGAPVSGRRELGAGRAGAGRQARA